MIAALYVDQSGPYWDRPDVDAWDVDRDATGYRGPWPVVAHPPCGPWGALAQFCTEQNPALAVQAAAQVRKYGGVLEHPAGSRLWARCGMAPPGMFPDRWGGRTVQVDQCRWGHRARKRTWIYLVGTTAPPRLPPWREPTAVVRPDANGTGAIHLPKSQRHLTPAPFAEWLLAIAGQVAPGG